MKYTVQRGDTLWLIARRYGVSLDDLIAANPNISDPDYIQVGLIIDIPRESNEYVVKKGDTMWLIAKRFGVSLDDLIKANSQISDPNKISVGDVIFIPEVGMEETHIANSGTTNNSIANTNITYKNMAPISTAHMMIMPEKQEAIQPIQQEHNDYVKNMHYVVKTGDTLFKIAKMFGVSLPKLIEANKHIENPDKIYPGNKIKVPVEKEYVEKKYNQTPTAAAPAMKEMTEKTATAPMMHEAAGMQAMPSMPMMQDMPMMHEMQTMPGMNHNCPMMHHCPCMHMMHMMNMQQPMHMMEHPMQMQHPMHHTPYCKDMMHQASDQSKQQMHHSSNKGCKHSSHKGCKHSS